jgi:putative membrane protein
MDHVLAQAVTRVYMSNGHHWWRGLIALAVFAAIIGLVVWAVVRLTSHRQPSAATTASPGRMSAEDVLADRLARGEIDTEEYRQRLSALRGG